MVPEGRAFRVRGFWVLGTGVFHGLSFFWWLRCDPSKECFRPSSPRFIREKGEGLITGDMFITAVCKYSMKINIDQWNRYSLSWLVLIFDFHWLILLGVTPNLPGWWISQQGSKFTNHSQPFCHMWWHVTSRPLTMSWVRNFQIKVCAVHVSRGNEDFEMKPLVILI